MADETQRRRRLSSHSQDKLDSAITEGRYESLKSIERLLDNDVRDMLRQRRTSLPVLQVGGINLVARRRTSELSDCMEFLANARREAINGLFPNVDATLLKSMKDQTYSLQGLNEHLTDTKSIQVNANDFDDLEGNPESKAMNNHDTTEWQDGFIDTENILKDRSSIRDDDFQHFLGIRYLEICNKQRGSMESIYFDSNNQQSKPIRTSNMTQCNTQTVQRSRSNALNVKLLALAKSRRKSSFYHSRDRNSVNQTIKLPPILSGKGIKQRDFNVARQAIGDCNVRRVSTGVYDEESFIGVRKPRKGIPCHSEHRARTRYPRRLEALLSKFRDLSSVTQKTEQERVVKKMDAKTEWKFNK